jgi:FkbM family methyltransferase
MDKLKKILRPIKNLRISKDASISYSQTGEDLIVDFIFKARNILNPSYIDLGAYHPIKMNNTYLFYSRGSKGINIEPNVNGFLAFEKPRPKDLNLNIGVSNQNSFLDYFMMNDPSMNSFSKSNAEDLVSNFKFKIERVIKVEVKTINEIINQYFKGEFPDFLSIDIEGLDFEIIKSIDFQISRPKVICIESIEYAENGKGEKRHDLINYIISKDYIQLADTYINTIFVSKTFWYI